MTYSNEYVKVYDDVCDARYMEALRNSYNANLNHFYADKKDWGNSNLQTVPGLRGRQVIVGKHENKNFPTGQLIDHVIRAVLDRVQFDYGWVRVDERIYMPGSEMSWHCDGLHLQGAATLYLNDWHTDWGGEFIYVKSHCDVHPNWEPYALETDNYASNYAIDNECGVVYPKSNRLVLIEGDVMHKINRIDERAKARYALQFHFHYDSEMSATEASSFLDV